ncbi:GNAT family N-acetyltransferase, partial [Streptomyces anulatus]
PGSRTLGRAPGEPAVARVYAGIGYRRIGEKVNISLDPAGG